jgi:hypothetical protein
MRRVEYAQRGGERDAGRQRERFRWTAGESEVAGYESTPGKARFFCAHCGSHLMAAWDGASEVVGREAAHPHLDLAPGAVARDRGRVAAVRRDSAAREVTASGSRRLQGAAGGSSSG